jgi:hypothetical protein
MAKQSFFALCKPKDTLVVKMLSVDAGVQTALEKLFADQERGFKAGIQDEVEFNGDWTPDEEELLYVKVPAQTSMLTKAVQGSSLSFPVLDAKNFQKEGVKAIFTGKTSGGKSVVAIQKFSSQQLLGRKLTLTLSRNVLNRLTDPTFTLDNKLVGLIEDGRLKFKSYFNIRMIFDLSSFYQAATDDDIDDFVGHACLEVANVNALKAEVDQTARKLIHAIQREAILDAQTATEIQKRAKTIGLTINVKRGKVQMPADRVDIKRLLRFLHDDIYEAPLSRNRYVTNSKKPA